MDTMAYINYFPSKWDKSRKHGTSFSTMRRNHAFTLIEVLVVVLIIGILLAVGVPNWMKARESARRTGCIGNLKLIGDAKEQFAMENRKGEGDPVTNEDLHPLYLKWNTFPACPSGGEYTVNPVGTPPQCDIHGTH